MQIGVKIEGNLELLRYLKHTKDGLVDLRVPLGKATKYLREYFAGVSFISRGSVYGQRWPQLNPAYELRKLKQWGSRPMLVASGKMQRSFVDEVHPMTARVWNKDPKFNYHQSDEPRHRIPLRVMIGVNPTNEREVNRIVNDHIRLELLKLI